jgi:uncharacterized secreted protein with C-terminal beta-propeller domain
MPSRLPATLPWKIQLPIESLEARQLLSAAIQYGDWVIEGTDAADALIIQFKPGGTQTLQAVLNNQTFEVTQGSIDDLRIEMGAGDDSIVFKTPILWVDEVVIHGGDGNDSISGSPLNDEIRGDNGDDVILGRGGDDDLDGGVGKDLIIGGSGNDEIQGQAGDDSISGGAGQDSINGNGGNDSEFGGDGNDLLVGNAGDDSIHGGDGNDILAGGLHDDQLKGGKGDDQIDGSFGSDVLWGGGGRDTLHGGASADQFDGGSSADMIYRQSKLDQVRADKSDKLEEEQLSVPLVKNDAAKLKASLIDAAVGNWQNTLGDQRVLDQANRYYDRGADGKLFEVDPATGKPSQNSLLGGCSGGGDYSETNIQEEGVDEADVVKTDGQNIYLLDDNHLIIMSALPAKDSHILSTTDIEGQPTGLYLKGNLLTVLSRTSRSIGDCPGYYDDVKIVDGQTCIAVQSIDQVKVTVFDVSKPQAPAVVEDNLLDGSLNTSRVIDGKLYLVLYNYATMPAPKATYHLVPPLAPDWNGQTRDYGADITTPGYIHRYSNLGDKAYLEQVGGYLEYESEASYRKRLSAMSLDELAPSYTSSVPGAQPISGNLLNPNTVYSGPTSSDSYDYWRMSSVVAIDTGDRKGGIESSAAVTGVSGDNIYVSRNSAYLAASTYETPMGDWQGEYRTDLYKFDLSPKGINLVASGAAPGSIIDSFAMDEKDGRLRIATTSGTWSERSGNVFVMEQHGQSLQIAGGLSDLGVQESVRSARFDGDRGYIVTFLRQDPLFVIDLSNPIQPKLSGELEIPGFSSYLHPIDDHRIIGVGQNATAEGWRNGLQVSLFDVSDPAHPTRPANFLFQTDEMFDWTESIAQNDHHAFAYFPQQGILALPVSAVTSNGYESTVYLLRIGKDDITLVGKVPQKGFASRNVRIGGNLYAISSDEVKIVELANPQNQIADVQLPGPPADTTYVPWFGD